MSCIIAFLVIPGAFAIPETSAGHLSGLTAKITLPDGSIRMAKIEGMGCSVSLCSRVAIKGRANGGSLTTFWLDRIAAIRDTTEKDAFLVMKDGTGERVSLVNGFRVLYLANRTHNSEKLDLARIRSLEILPSTN